MSFLLHSIRMAATGTARLALNIARICLSHISNQQISDEWVALVVAEAEEEMHRRIFSGHRASR